MKSEPVIVEIIVMSPGKNYNFILEIEKNTSDVQKIQFLKREKWKSIMQIFGIL